MEPLFLICLAVIVALVAYIVEAHEIAPTLFFIKHFFDFQLIYMPIAEIHNRQKFLRVAT